MTNPKKKLDDFLKKNTEVISKSVIRRLAIMLNITTDEVEKHIKDRKN